MITEITDLTAPEVALYANLRRTGNLFIAESVNVINAALETGCRPVSMLCERRHIEGKAAELVSRLPDIPVYTAPDEVLASITGYELHRGMLCAFERPKEKNAGELLSRYRTVCVPEGLTDTTNLGAIFRSAAALGIGAMLLAPDCCDPLSRRALRVSMGNTLRIPWARLGPDYPSELKRAGFTLCALALTENSVSITDQALKQADKLALLLGNEGNGLRPETIAACSLTAKIPMGRAWTR